VSSIYSEHVDVEKWTKMVSNLHNKKKTIKTKKKSGKFITERVEI